MKDAPHKLPHRKHRWNWIRSSRSVVFKLSHQSCSK